MERCEGMQQRAECTRRSEENSDNAVPGIFIPGISFVLKETTE